jgi:hypothetical protein
MTRTASKRRIIPLASTLDVWVSAQSTDLIECVEHCARVRGKPIGPLFLQALLQLPRIANENGFAPRSSVEQLLHELAQELPNNSEWIVQDVLIQSPRCLQFEKVGLEEGRAIMARFHYLRSPRLDGRLYGLRSQGGQVVAICVSSPLDVQGLGDLLRRNGREPVTARVLSRVFAFEGAPRNTISYLLSRAAREERRCGITDWVTYVNANMGFSGVSYVASGWHLLGEEPGTTYRYLDNRYITDRQLAANFGLHDDDTYTNILGARFAKSKMRLSPLMVFSQKLSR